MPIGSGAFRRPVFLHVAPRLAGAALWPGAPSKCAPVTGEPMPLLTPSDLSDLARYLASLRSAARALWGSGLVPARSGPVPRAPENPRFRGK